MEGEGRRDRVIVVVFLLQDEFVVGVPKKKHLQPYDRYLKNFQYRNALDAALKVYIPVCSEIFI